MTIKLRGYLVKHKIAAKYWTPGELATTCGEATTANEKALIMALRLEHPKAKLTPQYDRG